jgi:hypothetical protein
MKLMKGCLSRRCRNIHSRTARPPRACDDLPAKMNGQCLALQYTVPYGNISCSSPRLPLTCGRTSSSNYFSRLCGPQAYRRSIVAFVHVRSPSPPCLHLHLHQGPRHHLHHAAATPRSRVLSGVKSVVSRKAEGKRVLQSWSTSVRGRIGSPAGPAHLSDIQRKLTS